ncbi:MAG: glycoside hydrolase domain-containing protein, partial [Acidobacteriota bacterium]
RGTIEIRAGSQRRAVPIELEVFDFSLPDENSMHAMLFYSSDQPERYHGRNLDAAYHRLAHRYRVELVQAYDEQTLPKAWGRFSGDDFTREHGYEGPGDGLGNVLAPRSVYGPGSEFEDRASAWARSDAWMTFLREKLPRALTFLYMPDEPRAAEYAHILALADNIHSNPGPGRALPIFVTSQYVEALDRAIDIWCSGPKGFQIERAASERARGREFWFYNGGRPQGGAITIDAPATDARTTIWAAAKHDVRVYFYWNAVHWRHNSQKVGERDQNVWANSITFDNRRQANKSVDDQGYIHGDGVLIYPGEERLHPEEDRGVPGPIATIQLANFRRGLQDHQYLALARRLGLQSEVDAALAAIVPRVFSDAGTTVSFPETGDPYEAVRLRLARAIAKESARSKTKG